MGELLDPDGGADDASAAAVEADSTALGIALDRTRSAGNARLFIASGVNHCGGGPGADSFDLLTPTVRWVEQGVPMATPIAAKRDELGGIKFTRPLCQYPRYPRYGGAGDMALAASYSCAKP